MRVNLVQQYEYSSNFISGVFVNNSFVFSTDNGLLIITLDSDLFRQSADYKVIRTLLPYSKEKPFDDKNFKEIRHQRPVMCPEHNLIILPNSHDWHIIYMENNSNIVFLDKDHNGWLEKFSDIPQNWFLIVSKKPSLLLGKQDNKSYKIGNQVFCHYREREKLLQIKNFVFTDILKYEDEIAVYGIICCHVNNMLTFWSSKIEKSLFLMENTFHDTSIRHLKWFQITDELSWLLVLLTNGQIYVHEICSYPYVQNSFILWSDEDFACVKNILVQNISNNQCLILITKMSFILVILYSLSENKIVSIKREMIPKTAIIAGFTYITDKRLLILVTDVGKFVCMYLSIIESKINYTLKTIDDNFSDQVQHFTCNSVVFSKNQCTCALLLQCNTAKYSKNDGQVRNKVLLCTLPENLVEIESKILSVNNYNYVDVIDCIETLRINKMNGKLNELYQLDRKLLDKCPIQYVKLTYWKIAFKNKKNERDETILQELQMLLHVRFLVSCCDENKIVNNMEQYYYRIMLSYYSNKLPAEYVLVKTYAANLIHSFIKAKHIYFCKTCERIMLSFTDYRMFICELGHKELRCPVTLGPLGMPYLVCSMCFTMANVNAKNQSCVWCFGKYVPNKLLL